MFNPEFQNKVNSQIFDSGYFDSLFKVKYVLFLEHYLIVQFDSFYQLYNIKEELISIQIAANNFNAYINQAS